MKFPRSSGILLHPTSLPGPFGIGDLGPEAHRFADWLAGAGQHIWQVLPIGPTGYGDSPYQSFSAFAGNPLLISLDVLVEQGWLAQADIARPPAVPPECVDFGAVYGWKIPLLKVAAGNFAKTASTEQLTAFDGFCEKNAAWLDDYALFMALKEAQGVWRIWTAWTEDIARRDPAAMAKWRLELARPIWGYKFAQFIFFEQWAALKAHCAAHKIQLMGDIPIYVAHDSADVWAHPEDFQLGADGNPLLVAGVPPDYFTADGQRWGNPIYQWDRMKASSYEWWIERFRATFALFDMVRLDHFRGFVAYWASPATETTARNGQWYEGPGASLFAAVQEALGPLPIVAENLGVITEPVEALRHQFNLPGMSILQFAFGTDPQGPDFRPHNYPRERAAYTGTHDNDTTIGWWTSSAATDSTRSEADIEMERAFTRAYLNSDGSEINWVFIRALMASVADTVLVPLQDVIGLGTEARMNLPGRPSDNWQWRYTADQLTAEAQQRLRELATLYDRN